MPDDATPPFDTYRQPYNHDLVMRVVKLEVTSSLQSAEIASTRTQISTMDAKLAGVGRDVQEMRRYLGGDPAMGDRGILADLKDSITDVGKHVLSIKEANAIRDERAKNLRATYIIGILTALAIIVGALVTVLHH